MKIETKLYKKAMVHNNSGFALLPNELIPQSFSEAEECLLWNPLSCSKQPAISHYTETDKPNSELGKTA